MAQSYLLILHDRGKRGQQVIGLTPYPLVACRKAKNPSVAAILAYDFPTEMALVYVLIIVKYLMYNSDKNCKLIFLDIRLHIVKLEY